MSLTVHEILRGTGVGHVQSAGLMQVIPILGEDDDTFAPPELTVGTSGYGTVLLRNDSDRPTIVPTAAGWVVAQRAQDHAIGSGVFLKPKESRAIDTAMCVQQGQGGYIAEDKHGMLILPAALRPKALSVRNEKSFNKLWASITELNKSVGLTEAGHLEYFLKGFQKELDEFVAEFEIVPKQRGAIILIGGEIAGVEIAPSSAYWEVVWTPLIRVCYGSLAASARKRGLQRPQTRAPLRLVDRSIDGIRDALVRAEEEEGRSVMRTFAALHGLPFEVAGAPDDRINGILLTTVANARLSGQVVRTGFKVLYASLCAAA